MNMELLGFNIDNYTFDEAIEKTKQLIDSQKVSQIVTINPEMIQFAEKNPDFANIINNSELIIPDGIGIEIGLKLTGQNLKRIPGIDFAKRLLQEAAINNIPVAIIGAKEEVIVKAIENLKKEITGLNIIYYHNGYFSNNETIYTELKQKSPKLILVALGSPKQEEFIYNAKNIINPALMIGIGGSLDVWSGYVKRAPKIFQMLGLEWLYRTISQPARFKRIFPTLPMFLIKVLTYKNKI